MHITELYTRPAFNLVPLAAIPLSKAGSALGVYLDGIHQKENPELQAFAFYFLDHCVALIKSRYSGETIPDDLGEVVKLYHTLTTMFGSDMYAYLLLICNREYRYCKSDDFKISKVLGDIPAAEFGASIKNVSSTGALDALKEYKGKASLGSYCEVMTKGYYELDWASSFGGKKWGDIAQVLENYVLGRIPLVALLDQSFSLQHNTSAIFNKGTVYHKEAPSLTPLLDLQHSGQIIALAFDLFFGDYDGLNLKSATRFNDYKKPLKQAFVVMAKHFKGLDQHVNWDTVIHGKHETSSTKLGNLKKMWLKQFGVPTSTTTPKDDKTYYYVAPNEKYATYKRKK